MVKKDRIKSLIFEAFVYLVTLILEGMLIVKLFFNFGSLDQVNETAFAICLVVLMFINHMVIRATFRNIQEKFDWNQLR